MVPTGRKPDTCGAALESIIRSVMSKNYHNKGQSDASRREFNRPHGVFKELVFGWGREGRRMSEENRSYRKGYEEGKRKRG